MKRFLSIFLIFALIFSLCACSSSTQESSQEAPNSSSAASSEAGKIEPYTPSDEPVTLRWTGWGSTTRHDQRMAWVKEFQKENPNFTIEYEAETEDSMVEKILIQSQAGEAPDIYQNTSYHLDDFWEKRLCMDLKPFIESGALSTEGYENMLAIGQTADGVQVQWPTQAATVSGIYYNEGKLKELGVPLPENGWTWSDFEKVMRSAKEALGSEKIWACQDEGGNYRFLETWLLQRGKSFCSQDGLNFDKEDLIEWLTLWKGYRDEGLISPADITSENSGKSWQESLMMTGKALMFIQSYGLLITAREISDMEINLVSPPWVEGGTKATPVISAGYCISAITDKPAETAYFLNWMNQSEKVQMDHFDFYGVCTNEKYNDKFKNNIEAGSLQIKDGTMEIMALQEYLAPFNVPYPPNPSGSTNAQELLITANEMVSFGSMTIEEAVDDFFVNAEQVFKRN